MYILKKKNKESILISFFFFLFFQLSRTFLDDFLQRHIHDPVEKENVRRIFWQYILFVTSATTTTGTASIAFIDPAEVVKYLFNPPLVCKAVDAIPMYKHLRAELMDPIEKLCPKAMLALLACIHDHFLEMYSLQENFHLFVHLAHHYTGVGQNTDHHIFAVLVAKESDCFSKEPQVYQKFVRELCSAIGKNKNSFRYEYDRLRSCAQKASEQRLKPLSCVDAIISFAVRVLTDEVIRL